MNNNNNDDNNKQNVIFSKLRIYLCKQRRIIQLNI